MKPVCPRCRSVDVDRNFGKDSPWWQMLFKLLIGYDDPRYTCNNCGNKFD